MPAPTMFVSKCYGTWAVDVFFRMNSGEARTIPCSSDVQQGNPMGPAMFCVSLRPGLKRFREEVEREKVFVYKG